MENYEQENCEHGTVNSYTVIVPIKRRAYFQFSDKMSLNFEMSLNYKSSKFFTSNDKFWL